MAGNDSKAAVLLQAKVMPNGSPHRICRKESGRILTPHSCPKNRSCHKFVEKILPSDTNGPFLRFTLTAAQVIIF